MRRTGLDETGVDEGHEGAGVAIRVRDLTIGSSSGTVLRSVDLRIRVGERRAIIGASGAGKSTLCLALLGYVAPGLNLKSGDVETCGTPVIRAGVSAKKQVLAAVRRRVGRLDQDPARTLTPTHRVGRLLVELAPAERRISIAERARALAVFGLPDDPEFLSRFPAEISGGQRRRVALARTLLRQPELLILDEPTAGLDSQARDNALELVEELVGQTGATLVVITHDPAVAAYLAERVTRLDSGTLAADPSVAVAAGERRTTARLTGGPPGASPAQAGSCGVPVGSAGTAERAETGNETTEDCRGGTATSGEKNYDPQSEDTVTEGVDREEEKRAAVAVKAVFDTPVLRVRNLEASAPSLRQSPVIDLNFDVYPGEALALTGPSGCGKSTVVRTLCGLWPRRNGEVWCQGEKLPPRLDHWTRSLRGCIGWVPQDPAASINPVLPLGVTLRRAQERNILTRSNQLAADEVVALVGLPAQWQHRRPGQLSGGQLQRFAIARALVSGAALLLLDEATANLDVTTRDELCDLLVRLKAHLPMLVVTHDPEVVWRCCDRQIRLGGQSSLNVSSKTGATLQPSR
ncbi:MAG: ABC transporter ATP-binding protein [Actinomycetaceae bacterium]|nr:ABC transporter ATP-binding protein [Actinomycetaceae bacterium]